MDQSKCCLCGSKRVTRYGNAFSCQDCGRKWRDSAEAFRCILKRIYSEENKIKYDAICTQHGNEEENRIWKICERFWPKEYERRLDIEKYPINDCLDDATAQKLLVELEQLLDHQGWKK